MHCFRGLYSWGASYLDIFSQYSTEEKKNVFQQIVDEAPKDGHTHANLQITSNGISTHPHTYTLTYTFHTNQIKNKADAEED